MKVVETLDQADLIDAIFNKLTDRAARSIANVVAYGDEKEIAQAFAAARLKLTRECDLLRSALDRDEAY